MSRVVDVLDESLDYIRHAEFLVPVAFFCVGFGLMGLGLEGMMDKAMLRIHHPLLLVGGAILTSISLSQFYILYWDRK